MEQRAIKSAERVLEIMDFLTNVPDSGFKVKDLVEVLNYPQSSCSAMLKRLIALGYISYVPEERRFVPTARIGLMGSSFLDRYPATRLLADSVNQLHEMTGDLCFVAQRNGAQLQYISFKQAQYRREPGARVGMTRPLALAATGKVMLSHLPMDEACRILRRNNAEAPAGDCRISETLLQADLMAIREAGVASSDPRFAPGLIGFATAVKADRIGGLYAIGVAVPSERVGPKSDKVLDALVALRNGFAGAMPSTAPLH